MSAAAVAAEAARPWLIALVVAWGPEPGIDAGMAVASYPERFATSAACMEVAAERVPVLPMAMSGVQSRMLADMGRLPDPANVAVKYGCTTEERLLEVSGEPGMVL